MHTIGSRDAIEWFIQYFLWRKIICELEKGRHHLLPQLLHSAFNQVQGFELGRKEIWQISRRNAEHHQVCRIQGRHYSARRPPFHSSKWDGVWCDAEYWSYFCHSNPEARNGDEYPLRIDFNGDRRALLKSS